MAIDAKRVDANGNIRTVRLTTDDPSDVDLIGALGGKGNLITLGQIGTWEVLTTSEAPDEALVVGRPPFISDYPKRRTSCTLDDDKISQIVKLIRDGWKILHP